jgi:hypothetical protein
MTRRRRRWLRFIVALVLIYFVTMTFGGCANTLILRPPPGKIDAGAAKQLMIPVKDRKLEIWAARSPAVGDGEPQAFVLEFCGNATRAEQIAQYVAQRWRNHPVETWVMNYPGYGASEGGKKFSLIPPSAMAAYDAIAQRAAGRPIFLAGNSLGTTSALYVAAHRPAAGVICQNPPPLRRLILQRYGWFNLWLVAGPVALQIPSELDSLDNAPNVKVPGVFVLADGDGVVPNKYSHLVYDAYAGEKQLIELHGNHNSSVTGDAEKQLGDAIDHLWSSAVK